MLHRRKIHISAIKVTHIPHNQNYKLNGYRIITTQAEHAKKEKGGIPEGVVAILIHEDLENHIVHIHRVSHGIVKITLHIAQAHTPIAIINTYASHKGKTKQEQHEHWKHVHEVVKDTPRRHLIIWRADANGQMGK